MLRSLSTVIGITLDQSCIPRMPPKWSWCLIVFCVAGLGVLFLLRIHAGHPCFPCAELALVMKTLTSEGSSVERALRFGVASVFSGHIGFSF